MYISRKIDAVLLEWKDSKEHKPLLLRGARQTGKTTAVRHLAEAFVYFIEINFEQSKRVGEYFSGDFDVRAICSNLELRYNVPVVPGKTLLFFDEIQSCPDAISALRYFYEDMPGLHVIATGSLLEFVFSELHDFGVGRIRNIFMYPFSFGEFACALGRKMLYQGILHCDVEHPLPVDCHCQALDILRSFMIVGGMPAVVRKYLDTGSYLEAQHEQDDILVALKSDFDKYHRKIASENIRDTLRSVIKQTGEKFVYSNTELGLDSRQAKQCIQLLEQAKLLHRIFMSYGNGLPLGGEINQKVNKYLFLDTGLYLRESGLDLSEWTNDTPAEFVNRGKLGEMFAGLELLKATSPFLPAELYHWHREERSSNAEVDYLVQVGNEIVPVEVKSGSRGSMQSLGIFMAEKKCQFGVRTSQENFGKYNNIIVIPLYAIGEYRRYLQR